MPRPASRTVIRMWNKDGYHKDVAVLDSVQIRMTEGRVGEPTGRMAATGWIGPSVVINPTDFPEAVCFQVVVTEE